MPWILKATITIFSFTVEVQFHGIGMELNKGEGYIINSLKLGRQSSLQQQDEKFKKPKSKDHSVLENFAIL